MIQNKAYPKNKDSGQVWLGAVPQHWSVLPNRAIFAEVKDRNHPDEEMLSVTINRGVIKQEELLSDSSKKDSSNLDKSAYKRVQPGDIAYNKMRAWQGAVGASELRGIVSPAYVVMRLRDERNVSRYFHYLYRTPQFAKEAERWSYGITSDMWSLRAEHFKMIYTPLPPTDEQAAIVRFLEYANRRIAHAIRAKQKLIALLDEQEQVIIHRAVTRGLDLKMALKPSGVLWLGNIPKHWETITIGAATNLIQTGPFGSQLHSHEYVVGGIPVVNPSHMQDGEIRHDAQTSVSELKAQELERHRMLSGDIVAARRGELGRCAFVTDKESGFLCGTGSLLIRCKPSMFTSAYLRLVFSSPGVRDELRLASIGATMENLNAGMVARLRVPRPPLREQGEILEFVRRQQIQNEDTLSTVEREIRLLREYQTRLTADIVTGKLDVRAAVGNLPAKSEELDTISEIEPEEEAKLVESVGPA
jgi:type I restriction enzyme, S subunit